jgi:hypothetical protein
MNGDQLVLKKSKHSRQWWVRGRPGQVRLGEVEVTIAGTDETLRVEVVEPLHVELGNDGEIHAFGAIRELPALDRTLARLDKRFDALARLRPDPATTAMVAQVRARVAAGINDSDARRLVTALDAALTTAPRRPRRPARLREEAAT